MRVSVSRSIGRGLPFMAVGVVVLSLVAPSRTQPPAEPGPPPGDAKSSYDQIAPVLLGKETFQTVLARDKADKPAVMARQKKLLEERYDLTPRPDPKVRMTRGKPIPVGPPSSSSTSFWS